MATVVLVYPHDPGQVAAPWSIGNHLAAALQDAGYLVHVVPWDQPVRAEPNRDDCILLGHPHPDPNTTFRLSLDYGWAARIALAPWTPSPHCAWALEFMPRVDHFCAITGTFWWACLPHTPWGVWQHKMSRHDMAVNTDHYPRIKHDFAVAGKRRFVYLGCHNAEKGVATLAAASEQLRPEMIYHVGFGAVGGRVVELGQVDFGALDAQRAMRHFDVLIAPGGWDANPTTVVESMAWGLVPLCGTRAGYGPGDGVLVFNGSEDRAVGELVRHCRTLDQIGGASWVRLRQGLRETQRRLLRDRYSWRVVCAGILEQLRRVVG